MVKKRRVTSTKKGPKKTKKPALTIEQILNEGDEAIEALDISRANTLFQTAAKELEMKLKEDPELFVTLSKVLGKLGETKVSMGDQEGARQDFERAIALLNDEDEFCDEILKAEGIENKASLYMNMGQLSSDDEALRAYNKGVELLETAILFRESRETLSECKTDDDNSDGSNPVNELRKQLCGAYCTIAELYMTDLCFAENAEAACEASVQKAMHLMDSSDGKPIVDALQTLASLRISQSRGEEAIEIILDTYSKIKTGCEALAALVGLSEVENSGKEVVTAVELVEVEAANSLPGFEFRCQTARILLECASICKEESNSPEKANQCANSAIQVLGSLLAENDEVVETWYLTGCAFAALTPVNTEDATGYFEQALDMLVKIKDDITSMEDDGCEQILDLQKQIEDIQDKLNMLGSDPNASRDTSMEET